MPPSLVNPLQHNSSAKDSRRNPSLPANGKHKPIDVATDHANNDNNDEHSPLLSPASETDSHNGFLNNGSHAEADPFEATKSVWQLILLTISLGGLQIAWSVELSNGSPYLLSLGLSKSLMALVWIAGPLSGTLVQPYVGMLSDRCRIPWGKRKPFMLGGAIATIASLLMLAWTKDIVGGLLGFFGADPASNGVRVAVIVVAVAWVYILDFAINTVQAAIRAFIVDCAPSHQQEAANAMASRIVGVGNILGYVAGYANLPSIMSWLGNTQFKDLCAIASIALGSTVLLSCLVIKERDPRLEPAPATRKQPGVFAFFFGLFKSIRRLPPQIRQVCVVQFCAWIGFFPMLFYTSSYIGEIYVEPFLEENPNMTSAELDDLYERATRVGTFALLIFSITSLITNLFLPFFIAPTYDTGPAPSSSEVPGESPALPVRDYEDRSWTRHLVIPGLTLRRAWMLAQLLFMASMLCTVFVRTVTAATILVGLVGITWALTLWAPWAIISAEISRRDAALRAKTQKKRSTSTDSAFTTSSTATNGHDPPLHQQHQQHQQHEIDGYSSDPDHKFGAGDGEEDADETDQAGVILGIHNMAIAAPQIIATVASSVIFKFLQKPRGEPGDHSIAVVLALGGIAVGVSAFFIHRMKDDAGVPVVADDDDGRLAPTSPFSAERSRNGARDGGGGGGGRYDGTVEFDEEAEAGFAAMPDSPVSTRSRKSMERPLPRQSLERATLTRSKSFGGMDYA